MSELQVTEQMADEAITWFARLRADDVTTSDRENFVSWLRENRMHQFAFIEILSLWEDLAIVKSLDFEELQSCSVVWSEREKVRSRLDLAG